MLGLKLNHVSKRGPGDYLVYDGDNMTDKIVIIFDNKLN